MIPYTPLTGGQNLPNKGWAFDGFNSGVNTYSLATELRGTELASMINGELFGKRSIRPRRGGVQLGNPVGGAHVDGLFPFKNGITVNKMLAISNGVLRDYNSATSAWDSVAGATFTVDLRTRGVKMRSAIYFGNGTDDFTKYTSTSGLQRFPALAAPAGLSVTPVGTPGTAEYTYTVTTVTAKGQSLPATEVAIANGNLVLDTTNKNSVAFTRRTESQVIGYNIYGRNKTGTGVTLMKYIDQPASGTTITWVDDGTVTPQVWLPPDGDSTDGIVVEVWEQLRGSLVGAGDPSSRDRLYYSGTGDKYESFSPVHNGGWVDVRAGDNDGGISGLAPFESKIIVCKQNSVHQFYFSATNGDAVLQELITYVGCGAPGSMVVMENDVIFLDSDGKLRILGYEPNFAASIRTTSLTEGRVQSLFDNIDPAYLSEAEGVYFNGRYLLACRSRGASYNDMVLPYDRRYLAFLGKWDGADAHVKCWGVWDGADGKKRLYAGASDDDNVFEFGVEGQLANYDGTAIVTTIKTRNEDLGNSGQQKIWKWVDLRLFRIKGMLKLKTIFDGATTIDEKQFSSIIQTGWGIVKWGTVRWGVSTGAPPSSSDLDKTRRKEIYEIGNSLGFEITKEGTQDDFVLVSMRGEAFLLPTEVFNSENVI